MTKIKDTKSFMRITHRYLGFFMVGIMAVYAISGVLLVFRDTDFLKKEVTIEQKVAKNLSEKQLGEEVKLRKFEVLKIENNIQYFKEGSYNSNTGDLKYTKKELPRLLSQMNKLHKAPSKNKLAPLNVLFGLVLLFFVISSFWMFNTKSKAFKRGMIYTISGLIVSIIILLVA